MKKIVLMIYLCFIGIGIVNAKTISVEFSDCVDGDTAKFTYKEKEITARFLAIDTPETVHPTKDVEEFGKDASNYTCNKLKEANEIKLEYDNDSDKLDKYNRHLVWVFVDGELLQKKLVSKGYASVAYLYGDYKYTDELEKVEQEAEDNKLGIWSIDQSNENTEKEDITTSKEEKEEKTSLNYKEIIMLTGIVVIMCIFSTKYRKKVKSKVKREIKKRLK